MNIVIRMMQGAGDLVCFTGALRDLHAAHPGKYSVTLFVHKELAPLIQKTKHDATVLFDGVNKYRLEREWDILKDRYDRGVDAAIDPLEWSSILPHAQWCMTRRISASLGVPIPVTRLGGDLPSYPRPDLPKGYWLIFGAKNEQGAMLTKIWPHSRAVSELLRGVLPLVQAGRVCDSETLPACVADARGEGLEKVCQLVQHASGVISPVSLPTHLAGAYSVPAVTIAGGVENPTYFAYPLTRTLSTIGSLPCCKAGPCWKMICDYEIENHCMNNISAEDVVRAVRSFHEYV